MKKILTLALVVCMLLSVIPMAVSAEEINTVENVLYVSSTDGLESGADGTFEKPYKYFDDAYDTVTADTTIILRDDVALSKNNTARDFFLTPLTNDPVVTVRGLWNRERYSALDVTNTAADTCVLTLGTNMVFQDVNIKLTTSNKNVWICGGYHDVTFGTNFNNENLLSGTGTVSFAGANFGDSTNTDAFPSNYTINNSRDYVINLYSGTFNTFYLRCRNNQDFSLTSSKKCTLNYYSGTVTSKLYAIYSSDKSTGEDTINFYGNTDNIALKVFVENASSTTNPRYKKLTINFYNGITKFQTGIFQNGLTEENLLLRVKAVNYYAAVDTTAPYAPEYVGVQNTEKFTVTPEQGDAYKAYSVRFVGVVDKYEDYNEIGFKITGSNGNDYSFACKTVYSSIQGDGEDVSAAELGGNYIFAATVYNIPVDYNGNITFTVQPYTRVGETRTYGTAYDVTYNAGAHVSSVAVAAN